MPDGSIGVAVSGSIDTARQNWRLILAALPEEVRSKFPDKPPRDVKLAAKIVRSIWRGQWERLGFLDPGKSYPERGRATQVRFSLLLNQHSDGRLSGSGPFAGKIAENTSIGDAPWSGHKPALNAEWEQPAREEQAYVPFRAEGYVRRAVVVRGKRWARPFLQKGEEIIYPHSEYRFWMPRENKTRIDPTHGSERYSPRDHASEFTRRAGVGPELHLEVCEALSELYPDEFAPHWLHARDTSRQSRVVTRPTSPRGSPRWRKRRSGDKPSRQQRDLNQARRRLKAELWGRPTDTHWAFCAVFYAVQLMQSEIDRATWWRLLTALKPELRHADLAIWIRDHVTTAGKPGGGRMRVEEMVELLLDREKLIALVAEDSPGLAKRLRERKPAPLHSVAWQVGFPEREHAFLEALRRWTGRLRHRITRLLEVAKDLPEQEAAPVLEQLSEIPALLKSLCRALDMRADAAWSEYESQVERHGLSLPPRGLQQ